MFARLFYGGLVIGSLAMLLFLAGFVCFQLGLGLLTGLFYLVASKVMLLTLVLLALLGLLALCKAVVRDVGAYFNRETAAVIMAVSFADCSSIFPLKSGFKLGSASNRFV